ncbi:MAG: glycoside hydrolase family 97 N-terminal domain-containing protein [bacterium]|nr:glycoside hydrolase family 97 N-terminal domain-containing protein [bacterium]
MLKDTKYNAFDKTWESVQVEGAQIRNHYNEMLVSLEQPVGSVEGVDQYIKKG